MKRLLSSLCLTGYILGLSTIIPPDQVIAPLSPQTAQAAPAKASSDLYYLFYGQKIPLSVRQDTIAVTFKPQGRSGNSVALTKKLERTLQGGRRSSGEAGQSSISVQPLGDRYALIKIAADTPLSVETVANRVQQQDYVENTLPVLARMNGEAMRDETIVLPNEILLSFEPGLSNSQQQLILNQANLEVVRPLRFTQNRYLVKSKKETGVKVLKVANRLNGVKGVKSATPNFIQSLRQHAQDQIIGRQAAVETPDALNRIRQTLASLPAPVGSPYTSNLLPLQWHLSSTAQRGTLLPRTDIRAVEAWQKSNGGDGTVVAVIDSLIQWDHPDLVRNVYRPETIVNPLPDETNGWDFSGGDGGDPDTRINETELAALRPMFQDTFRLSNQQLLETYPELTELVRFFYPDYSDAEIASFIRMYFRSNIAAEFHGTWSAGVIAARPQAEQGVLGVAPNAKILPVRVFGLFGEISTASLVEAIGYSAERGADVINMSLGSLLPDQELTDQIFSILDQYPKLVIVASAGNESLDGVGFPAAIPGVVSVGATTIEGNRTFYSSFGGRLDLTAPGGETLKSNRGGILTTGGTGIPGFWEGMNPPDYAWEMTFDPMGNYVQVQGTSFSSPTVAGVVALMKGTDPDRRLSRDQMVNILKQTSNHESLTLSQADKNQYRLQAEIGFGTAGDFPYLRPSGIFQLPQPVSAEQYYFGSGLVNAEKAVEATQQY